MAENTDNIFQNRSCLPSVMPSRNDINIWAILKNCLGKDLSKITMPVILNEPLSFLQRICEYMEYAHILTLASQQENVSDRLKFVASFAVSALASNWERIGKPFNPLLGETFELRRNGYRILCEQVSHHPPVSAFHAESPDFKFHGSINPKIKFCGKSIEIHPKGVLTVELLKWNEAYTWNNINCCVHNVVVGKLWIEQYGTMDITNHSTGDQAIIKFKSSGCGWPKDLHSVEGFVLDKNKKNIYFLYGKWNEYLKCATYDCYEKYINKHTKQKDPRKFPHDYVDSTPKKMFSKLHSLKINSLRSLSIQDDENTPTTSNDDAQESTFHLEIEGSITLWKCEPRPEKSAQYYHFTNFAMQLNEIESEMKPPLTISPTDSRFRPDIKYLENGDLKGAINEKNRLEEKQRETSKDQNAKPRWFVKNKNPHTDQEDWFYTGGYWDRSYSDIAEIF